MALIWAIKYAKAWASIEADCKEAKQDSHVESILSRLRMMINAIGKNDTLSRRSAPIMKRHAPMRSIHAGADERGGGATADGGAASGCFAGGLSR